MAKRRTFYLHDMTYLDVAKYLKKCDVVMAAMGSLNAMELTSLWAVMP